MHYSQSPFLEMIGTQLEEWRDGYVRVSLDLKPFHLNRAGVIHGGVIATLLDHTGGFSGLFTGDPMNRRNGMTLSLTTQYINQHKSGKVIAIGERISTGRNIFFSKSEVRTQEGLILATGMGTYRYRGQSTST
ncbi:MAG: PaaI family thioesterase [Methylocystaceae bacterium]|nr:PaaI family thioesterase [Methylocystaceae bacterium]